MPKGKETPEAKATRIAKMLRTRAESRAAKEAAAAFGRGKATRTQVANVDRRQIIATIHGLLELLQ